MLKATRCTLRLPLWIVALVALQVSCGTATAEVGFRRITPLDQMVDPVRFPPRIGLSSTIWDSSAIDTMRLDSTLLDSLADSLATDSLSLESLAADTLSALPHAPDTLVADSLAPDTSLAAVPPEPVFVEPPELLPDSLKAPLDELAASPDTLSLPGETQPPSAGTGSSGTSSGGFAEGDSLDQQASAPVDSTAPPPWHPTNIGMIGLQIDVKSALDTTTGFVTFSQSLDGSDLALTGALPADSYIVRQGALNDRMNRRLAVIAKLPVAEKKEGLGLELKVPVFKSKRAQRIFGGPNIGLTVSGSIQIDGSLSTEKKDEYQADNKNPTNYAFKINQKQQFNIKGKVGEKVSVEIDQDSEKLFEFENSLRVRYKGDEDEIIQSVEAGNVSLSLGGSRLATASSNHKGLFGFKTESKLGPLKLITIASLDKGEKNSKKISGGAAKSEGLRIKPRSFVQGRYFFLDHNYRENYKFFDAGMKHVRTGLSPTITRLDVYKYVRAGENETAITGWAFFDVSDSFRVGQQVDKEHQQGNFIRLEPETDYLYDLELGTIRLTRSLENETILAAAWSSSAGTFGDLDPTDNTTEDNPFILKLIQPKSPQPTDATWDLMWRNVYDLQATGISEESFGAKITKTDGDGGDGKDVGKDIGGTDRTYIAIFDLDLFNVGIPGVDGKIDPMFVDFQHGELRFPDLHPFNPEGWYHISEQGVIDTSLVLLADADRDSAIYVTAAGSGGLDRIPPSNFTIIVQYSDASSSYSLGFGVLEGSEEVILNGRRLSRGTDYSIDYITGSLTIVNKEATAPGADLEIKYETGQIFQLDTQTMLGIRAEYELWENSTIGATLLHLSQKTVEQRVRVGGEPKENTVWDVNTQLRFKPEFLTRAVDWLPFIETVAPSNISFSAEIAQVFPNPNSLSSPSTGDNNGVAYVDDFESIKRSTPLGITRRQWTPSSFPLPDSRGAGRWERQRGRVLWYNPDQIKISDIWPERESTTQESRIQTFMIEFQPWWGVWDSPLPAGIDPEKSWGGLMRYLGPGYADQSQSKYLEVWLNVRSARQGTIYFDLGRISEDVIPNGKSNTEDLPRPGFNTGDGVVTKEEDTGFDGKAAVDPLDYSFINGIEYDSLPSYDDWTANTTGGEWRFLNGTEGNGTKSPSDEGGRIPDTEDLSGDGFADGANDFYRYRIDLSEGDLNRYIVGGQGNPKGWRLYRIPLTDTLAVGKPSLTQFDYVRLWFTGFRRQAPIEIATMEIVGNEWREVKIEDDRGGLRDPINIAVVNTHDNPEYGHDQPPGVAGDIDPVSGIREKEQSMVIRVNKLGAGEVGSAQKLLTQKMNLLEYRQLKMFVHGGGANGTLVDHFGRPLDLEMFLRFGSEVPRARNQAHYYEYSQRLSPGWAASNEIILDLERLASLKFLRESDSTHDYDILPDGDVIRVVGTPSLRNIGFIEIGLKNHGQEITAQDNVEIWADEMRVSDIYRNSGWAASGETRFEFADLLDITADITQRQADFHNLNERTRNDPADQLTGNFSTELQVGEVFDKPLGINIPVKFNFRQDVSIPKYKPNSDVKLTSISGENPGLWRRFMGDLSNANRFRQTQAQEGPIDSLVSTDKSYTITGGFSKTGKSDNILSQVTLDNFKFNGSFQEVWGRDYNSLLEYKRVSTGNSSYNLSMDKPPELEWMAWAADIPVLNKLSESTFRPVPTSLNLTASGNETYSRTLRRTGVKTGDTTFTIDRSYSTGWRPFQILNFDFSQSIGSSRVVEDTMRTMAAYRMSNLDSTIYWRMSEDSIRTFDTLAWREAKAHDIQRIKDKLFWKGFGYYFVDDELSQRLNGGFSPVFLSWLGTETNYSTSYSWRWGRNLGPADRSVRANANFTGTVTLRLPQLTSGWKSGAQAPKGEDAAGGIDDGLFDIKSPIPNRNKPAPGANPKGRFPELGSDGKPVSPVPDPAAAVSESGELLFPDGIPFDSLGVDSLGVDSLAASIPAADTLAEKKPRFNPPNLLDLGKKFVSKIRDVQYAYTQTGDVTNSGVAEGQADWAYRLGFTRDTGLDSVKGYFRENYNQSFRNKISTGYEITQNLTINNIEMTFVDNRNYGQQISGSTQRPVFMYFGKDKTSIKKLPSANWGIRWSGWESLPYLKEWATSISLDNNFNGSQTEQWRKVTRDTTREVTNVDYEKSFQPLLGINFAWKGGVGTNVRYNWNQAVQDSRIGNNSKSRNTTAAISVTGSYTSRKGFSIPIPVWPFKNRRFDNSTTFSLAFNSNSTTRESAARGAGFTVAPGGKSSSWSVSPSVDYTFSSAVRGGFRYTYSAQKSQQTSSKSQEFGFTVNISIRG